jgi:hypothetical protein
MMELLKSEKLNLPIVYFITDRDRIKDVPVGIPFVYGDKHVKKNMIRVLEYEVLYQAAIASGYPFNFRQILLDNGYTDLISHRYGDTTYVDYSSSETIGDDFDIDKTEPVGARGKFNLFKEYSSDSSAYVDMETLKSLNIFPTWLGKIEEAISTNIHNFAVHNPNMYNKKLEGMYGGIDLRPPSKNLIIIDISGSIPRAVSSTCLTLAKNLSETFYADIMITGSKSTLYSYDMINDLDVTTIYDENGMDNDQLWFRKLLTEENRSYQTAIVFGDDDHPGQNWNNSFNRGSIKISDRDGRDLCNWKIENVVSFHTNRYGGSNPNLAGYARWFSPDNVEKIEDWVKYLN